MTSNDIIYFFGLYWIISSFYVMNWHRRKNDLTYGTIFLASFFGPILSIIIYDSERDERKRKKEERERETGDRQRRWFRMNTPLNRNVIPDYSRTIPPPPPISRQRINPRDARAEWQRRNGYHNINNFKFFRNNVENRER